MIKTWQCSALWSVKQLLIDARYPFHCISHYLLTGSCYSISHMLPFGNIYHLSLTNSVPTHWPTCIPTYCSHISQHVQYLIYTFISPFRDIFVGIEVKKINALEVFLCFCNEDTFWLVYKLVLTLLLNNCKWL